MLERRQVDHCNPRTTTTYQHPPWAWQRIFPFNAPHPQIEFLLTFLKPHLQVVIIQPLDTGSKSHPFPHALVAGIDRYPSTVTRRMSKATQTKRSKLKPFIKIINYNHLMPTRYTLELEGLKGVISNDTFKEVSQREEAKKNVKKALEERYTSGKNRWFFSPLSKLLLIWGRSRLPGTLSC